MTSPALLTGACLLALSLQASAAQMTASFVQEAGSTWHVDLAVLNDGVPTAFSGYTVYFSELLYGGLSLRTSPSDWNSLLVQPDLALASAGFLDSALVDRTPGLRHLDSLGRPHRA